MIKSNNIIKKDIGTLIKENTSSKTQQPSGLVLEIRMLIVEYLSTTIQLFQQLMLKWYFS
jgi:hypothetical protein